MRTIGTSIQRVEDNRVLTGRGRYVDDVSLPGMLHAAFLRSPHPHARLTRIDVEAAKSLPGVVAVLTGADMPRLTRPMTIHTLPGYRSPQFFPLATDRVRFVGDPVAMVVADSRYIAEDALDLVEVDYEPLPPVTDARRAVEGSAPVLHEVIGGNVAATLD